RSWRVNAIAGMTPTPTATSERRLLCDCFFTMSASRSYVCEAQRPRLLCVDVGEPIFPRELGGRNHLASPAKRGRIIRECRNRTADELRTLRVAQIENTGSQHCLSPYETRIHRHNRHTVRFELVRHVGRKLVGRRLGNAVEDVADVLPCRPRGNG